MLCSATVGGRTLQRKVHGGFLFQQDLNEILEPSDQGKSANQGEI